MNLGINLSYTANHPLHGPSGSTCRTRPTTPSTCHGSNAVAAGRHYSTIPCSQRDGRNIIMTWRTRLHHDEVTKRGARDGT
jgi:hypothetical protein